MLKIYQKLDDFENFIKSNDSNTVKNTLYTVNHNTNKDLFEHWFSSFSSEKSDVLLYMFKNNMVNLEREVTVKTIMNLWWSLAHISTEKDKRFHYEILLPYLFDHISSDHLYDLENTAINKIDRKKIDNDKFPFCHFITFSHWSALSQLTEHTNAYNHLKSKSLQNRNLLHSIIIHIEHIPRRNDDIFFMLEKIEKIYSINYLEKDHFGLKPSDYLKTAISNIPKNFNKDKKFATEIESSFQKLLYFCQKQELYYELQDLKQSNNHIKKNNKI